MGELIAGIGQYAWSQDAAFSMKAVDQATAASYLRALLKERSTDGILLRTADEISEEILQDLDRFELPYVAIKRRIPGRSMNTVVGDDVAGGRLATSHLIREGYRRIAFVCAKPHLMFSRERISGYRAALSEEGLEYDDELVRQENEFTIEKGYQATKSLLLLSDPPDAIFVASDTMAIGGYEAARDLGLRIPDDVAFTGYDDIAEASVLQPPLTTVRTSYYDFGRLAAELLIGIIEGRETTPCQRVLEPQLMIRRSSRRHNPEAETTGKQLVQTGVLGQGGRLAGRVVVASGSPTEALALIAKECLAEGASVVELPRVEAALRPEASTARMSQPLASALAAASGDRELVGALIYSLELGDRIGPELESVAGSLQPAIDWMIRQGTGAVLLLASMTQSASRLETEKASAKAGLEYVTRRLADLCRSTGVRVNGVLLCGLSSALLNAHGARFLTGPAVFLTSDEGASITGQVLVVDPRVLTITETL
jgi:DNA-binding LacI/PurR family transcriptional regulator